MEPLDTKERASRPQPPPPVERRMSFAIVSLLVFIGAAMIFVQSVFDPSQWREQADNQQEAASLQSRRPKPNAGKVAVAGLEPMAAPERYDAVTLSDKINGKAELYLGAGFQGLETRRFSIPDSPGVWMERYVYDMGGQRSAFAVYSSQRRREAAPLKGVSLGFVSSNGLFFINGPHYVEIIASEASEPVQDKMKVLAAHFIQEHGEMAVDIPELNLFPMADQVPDSIVLIADSAFGLADMSWVFTAAYGDEEAQATAFIRRCGSKSEALALAANFNAYWTEFGGEAVSAPSELRDASIVTILDAFEIALVQDRYLVGVHEATHLDFGIRLTTGLQAMVKEAAQ